MHNYLQHLHADIRQRTAQLQTELIPIAKADPFEDHFAKIDAYLHGPEYDFEYWTDLLQDELPVPERLTDAQCAALVEALAVLWEALKIRVSFPESCTLRTQYSAMRKSWKISCPVGIEGTVMDFCSGYAPDCVFGKECPCREFWEEDELPP